MTSKFVGKRRSTEASIVLSSIEVAVQRLDAAGNASGPEVDLGYLGVDSGAGTVILSHPDGQAQDAPGFKLFVRERGRESRTTVTELLFEDISVPEEPEPSSWPQPGTVGFLGDENDLNPTHGRTVRTPGTVIENEWIDTSDGGLIIDAADVVIRNCKFSVGIWGVDALDGATNLVVEDCSFDGGYQAAIGLSQAQNWRISRCDFYGGRDAIKPGGSGVIEDCTMHDPATGGDAHNDCMQFSDCDGVIVRRNRLEGADTSCIAMFEGQGTFRNVSIEDNWMGGAGYLIYAGGEDGTNIAIVDNTMGSYGYQHPVTSWDPKLGNVFRGNVFVNGDPVPVP